MNLAHRFSMTNSSDSKTGAVSVALVQMGCSANKTKNVEKAGARIAEAAAAGAQIVCLQELFHGLYPCQSEDHARFDEAEPIPGPTSEALAAAAKKHKVAVIGSLFERRAAGVYHNTAVVFDADGQTSGVYRKMHIPDDPNYYEKFYFAPAIWVFRRSTLNLRGSARWCAGISGIRKRRG